MSRRRRHHRTPDSATRPAEVATGEAAAGAVLDPSQLPDETAAEHARRGSRIAPAPGSPLSNDMMKKLQAEAEGAPLPTAPPGQADPAMNEDRA